MHNLDSRVCLVSLGTRLRQARDAKSIGRRPFAERLGVSASTVQNYEKDETSPTAQFVIDASGLLDVDPAWLLTGHSAEHLTGTDTVPSSRVSEPAGPFLRRSGPYGETIRLTVYTHISAGAGEHLYGWEPSDEDDSVEVEAAKQLFAELVGFWPSDNLRGVRVRGDSMRRRYGGIEPGQMVLYEPVRSPDDVSDGARHVLTVSEGDESRVLVKRLQLFTGGGIKLISDNPASGVEDEVLVPRDGGLVHSLTGQPAHVQIIGRVVWPDEFLERTVIETVGRSIDHLVARGYLAAPAE